MTPQAHLALLHAHNRSTVYRHLAREHQATVQELATVMNLPLDFVASEAAEVRVASLDERLQPVAQSLLGDLMAIREARHTPASVGYASLT